MRIPNQGQSCIVEKTEFLEQVTEMSIGACEDENSGPLTRELEDFCEGDMHTEPARSVVLKPVVD